MSLETELDEVELALGHKPISGITHPNPNRGYPSVVSDWWKRLWGKIFGGGN